MGAIFISYRRSDSEGQSGRLFKDLRDRFGPDTVLIDVVGMQKGLDFRHTLERRLDATGVLLAVIGRQWVNAVDEKGQRRLDDAADFVRIETASALRKGIPVIPVLVSGAVMPREADLPDDLKALVFRDGVELTHARWDADVQLLIESLVPLVQPAKHWLRRRARALAASVFLAGVAAVGALYPWPPPRTDGKERPAGPLQIDPPAAGASRAPAPAAPPSAPGASSPGPKPDVSTPPPGGKPPAVTGPSLKIKGAELAKLDDIQRWMNSAKGFKLESVTVTGHNDNTVAEATGQKLSLQRAMVVKKQLVARGLTADRVYVEGRAAQQPVADNGTAAGRAANNRATILVLGSAPAAGGKAEPRRFSTEVRFE